MAINALELKICHFRGKYNILDIEIIIKEFEFRNRYNKSSFADFVIDIPLYNPRYTNFVVNAIFYKTRNANKLRDKYNNKS